MKLEMGFIEMGIGCSARWRTIIIIVGANVPVHTTLPYDSGGTVLK